jgi:hypothetical protein
MRNFFIILILNLLPFFIMAQIPNNSFEDWTNMGAYDNPNQWSSMNDITAASGIFTCEQGTPGYPGSFYIKITSRAINGMGVVQGIAVSGQLNTTTLQPVSGFPYSGRPQSMQGRWQFMAFGSDQGYISILLTKWNVLLHVRDTVAYSYQPLKGMVMSWREFDIPLTYFRGSSPDSAIIIASASNATGAEIADFSSVYLDNLSFYGSVAGIQEVKPINSFVIYPNPAQGTLTVQFDKALMKPVLVEILNSLGQKQISININSYLSSFPVNVSQLPSGIYSVKISSPGGFCSHQFINKN